MIIQESKEKIGLVEPGLQEDLNQLEMETFETCSACSDLCSSTVSG